MRRNLLDLYCCQGGASQGYEDAGWNVFGSDIEAQPRYRGWFHRGDALDVLRRLIRGEGITFTRTRNGVVEARVMYLWEFDAIHASPPCQLYSKTHRINLSELPDLIGPTRELLEKTGMPWIIENVEGAAPEMREPVMLCGAMFGLETYRHRLFETNWGLRAPGHPEHIAKTTKMGRPVKPGEFMHVVGNFTGVDHGRKVMGMDWANRDGLREAIPPAYAEWVGAALMEQLAVAA
jgi:DNA (cytosine-5)-methyltransferase 1